MMLYSSYNILDSDNSPGFSDSAKEIFLVLQDSRSSFNQSRYLFGEKNDLINEIESAYYDAINDNDDESCSPILLSYQAAKKFSEALPLDIIQPEISPEPSGKMGLYWVNDFNESLYLVFTNEKIIYSLISNKEKSYGDMEFTDNIPKKISDIFEDLFSTHEF